MTKIVTTVAALLLMGSVAFAQDAKKAETKKAPAKTETKAEPKKAETKKAETKAETKKAETKKK